MDASGRYHYDGGWNHVGLKSLAVSGVIAIGWELSTQLFHILPENNLGWVIGAVVRRRRLHHADAARQPHLTGSGPSGLPLAAAAHPPPPFKTREDRNDVNPSGPSRPAVRHGARRHHRHHRPADRRPRRRARHRDDQRHGPGDLRRDLRRHLREVALGRRAGLGTPGPSTASTTCTGSSTRWSRPPRARRR